MTSPETKSTALLTRSWKNEQISSDLQNDAEASDDAVDGISEEETPAVSRDSPPQTSSSARATQEATDGPHQEVKAASMPSRTPSETQTVTMRNPPPTALVVGFVVLPLLFQIIGRFFSSMWLSPGTDDHPSNGVIVESAVNLLGNCMFLNGILLSIIPVSYTHLTLPTICSV